MSKQLTVEEQIQQAVAQANKELQLKQQQREQNELKLGARLVSKRIQEGSPVIDKDTREQKIVNGIPQKYPDKYFVTLQFMGAELETEVKDKIIFDDLEEMKTYFCVGYIGEVKRFGSSYIEPIIRKYTLI